MAAQTAPFHGGMRLGQGYNSYTQELRLDEAVAVIFKPRSESSGTPVSSQVQAQPQSQGGTFAETSSRTTNDQTASDTAFVSPLATTAPAASGTHQILQAGENEVVGVVTAELPSVADPKDLAHAKLGSKMHDALQEQALSEYAGPRFVLPTLHDGQEPNSNQSVTFSTRAVNNMSGEIWLRACESDFDYLTLQSRHHGCFEYLRVDIYKIW